MKFQSSIFWFWLKFTCILLQTHFEEKEEYSLAVQKPEVKKKELSSVFKPMNYCKSHKLILYDIPPMYWTSPDVLMISLQCTHDIPRCTHDIPLMYWTPPDVLNISRCTQHTLYNVLNIPRCTHDIPPMYSWYPPMYSWYPPMYSWYPPDVLNTPRCTEHLPMYSTHIIQGGKRSSKLHIILI